MPDARPPGDGELAEPPAARHLILAFDFGRRRIGIACGDTVSRSASPLGAVPAGPGGPQWSGIDAVLGDWRPTALVVGLPYNADGSERESAAAARAFAAELGKRYGLPVDLVDERYSSIEAEERLRSARASGMRKRRVTKEAVDAAAACVILERWLSEKT
jgi:putative Holliday junction resolvase